MARLKDPGVYGRVAFDFTDEERLNAEVTHVTIDTGNAGLDSFLGRVSQETWCEVAEHILIEFHREGMDSDPGGEGLIP